MFVEPKNDICEDLDTRITTPRELVDTVHDCSSRVRLMPKSFSIVELESPKGGVKRGSGGVWECVSLLPTMDNHAIR